MPRLRIATRRSPLARWQAEHVGDLLRARDPSLSIELIEIVTRGDKILDSPLSSIGGKGLFVKEIEESLLDGRADLAVHSLKDVPAQTPPGLVLAAFPPREDPRDAFVSARSRSLGALPQGGRVGTASTRRGCQLKAMRPDLEVVAIRGNVQTRVRTVHAEFDGGVLALAGLKRLGLASEAREVLEPEVMLPAVGQGALAVQVRADDEAIRARVRTIDDRDTADAVAAERSFLARLGGGCQVPIAAYATVSADGLRLRGLVGWPDGHGVVRGERIGPRTSAADLGRGLAEALLGDGAEAILAALPHAAAAAPEV